MFIGDRRTKHKIRAFRSPADVVVIPKDAILRDVRTSKGASGQRCPTAMWEMVRANPRLHVFEYQGETLYMHFIDGLIGATTEIKPE